MSDSGIKHSFIVAWTWGNVLPCIEVCCYLFVWTLPLRAWVIPPMVLRSTENHKVSPMKQHAHLPLLSCWHIGQIPPLGGVTGPDQFGITLIITSSTGTIQRHHLTSLDRYLSGSPGTHTCEEMSHIVVHFSEQNINWLAVYGAVNHRPGPDKQN